MPFVSPFIVVECNVAPVVVKVFAIAEYAVFAVVEYLHVALSFVATDIKVDVVPDAKIPVGWPLLIPGGVVSGTEGFAIEKEIK